MKPHNEPKRNNPSSPAPEASAAPVAALERPTGLKKWASELIKIVKKEEINLFEGWDFGPGSLTRMDFGRILKKISGCGSVVELRSAMDRSTGEIGSPVIHAANFCGQHTICPYCAGRVQDRRGARFRDSIQEMARTYPYAYMVTATIPPVETWREDLNRLISGWQTFRRMGQKRGGRKSKRSRGEWGKVRAGLAKIEIKRGSGSGLPHCHYHALVFTAEPFDYRVWDPKEKAKPKEERIPLHRIPSDTDPRGWIPASKISLEWFQATDGTATNFRLDPLKYRSEDKEAGRSHAESIYEQSREVLKYATKFDSHPAAGTEALFARDFIGIRDATYNRRLFITYGDFRKVGGNDFEGGGPHISEGPIIWESRWRGVEYSPLIERSRPLFVNTDKSPAVSARLTTLNRLQGQIRRMRSAILKSKKHFREEGELRPAYYMRREYLEDGGFNDFPMVLEPPGQVAEAPYDPETWERWVDDVTAQGQAFYAQAKNFLALEGLERIDGTLDDQLVTRHSMDRAWRESDEYNDQVARLFRETIVTSRELIEAPS